MHLPSVTRVKKKKVLLTESSLARHAVVAIFSRKSFQVLFIGYDITFRQANNISLSFFF